MRSIIVIVSLIMLASCTGGEEKKPDDIWNEERFIDAMVEVQVTEAYIRLGFNRNKDGLVHKDSLYQSTFDKLDISKDEFEKNFEYYSARPKQMEAIYEKVIEKLSEKEAELQGGLQQEQE